MRKPWLGKVGEACQSNATRQDLHFKSLESGLWLPTHLFFFSISLKATLHFSVILELTKQLPTHCHHLLFHLLSFFPTKRTFRQFFFFFWVHGKNWRGSWVFAIHPLPLNMHRLLHCQHPHQGNADTTSELTWRHHKSPSFTFAFRLVLTCL